MRMRAWVVGAVLPCVSSMALAGSEPLYQPAPGWVVPATLPTGEAAKQAGALLLFDVQQRVDGDRMWNYVDIASKLDSPEALNRGSTVTLPWMPDKGDLIVHEMSAIRDGKVIDLLTAGQKLTVLRREQTLEQLQMTGILTATMPLAGLQVGDIVRLRMSVTSRDPALGGRVAAVAPLLVQPLRVGTAALRVLWPSAQPPHFKILASEATPVITRQGALTEYRLTLPLPKQPEKPSDAPLRFRAPPLFELSTFASWTDVSKVMAPLYRTDGVIAADSSLAKEVAAIRAMSADPRTRVALALRLVQDKVRYLMLGMNGGNYVPQAPAKTWELRYGDCKAKTYLLLAVLRAMDIRAEPVLAHSAMGDLIPARLPGTAAFDHIFVHATVGKDDLWLDGTGLGSRAADLDDVPPFGWVLPVRDGGSEPIQLPRRAPARAVLDLSLDIDESGSVDLPTVFDATLVMRGSMATMTTLMLTSLPAKEQRDTLHEMVQRFTGDAQIDTISQVANADAATLTIKAHGLATTQWRRKDLRFQRGISQFTDMVSLSAERGRAGWSAIPVSTASPNRTRYQMRIKLPENGQGYTLQGQADVAGKFGGYEVARATTLINGVATIDETFAASGEEIAADALPRERAQVSAARATAPVIIAPARPARSWNVADKNSQATSARAIYDQAVVQAEADDMTSLSSRASFRDGTGDLRGAAADYGRIIAVQPNADAYRARAGLFVRLGDAKGALADMKSVYQLDPSSDSAAGLAEAEARVGDLAGAIARLDEQIAQGGENTLGMKVAKAGLIGEFGEPAAGIAIFDTLIDEKPGSPRLLNARCWTKATRHVQLDSALKDCTNALELSSDTGGTLDSRGVVYLQLGRPEDALRDFDAALLQNPGQWQTHFVRGVALSRLGRKAEAAEALAIARRGYPAIDADYARFGLKP